MASKKNDAIEIDALLTPTLGDMSQVEKKIGTALDRAAKPLVDTIGNVKVGLDPKSMAKASKQLADLSAGFGKQMDESIAKVLSGDNKTLRTAAGLKELAKSDAGISKLVKILGGYEQASAVVSSPDAHRRLQSITTAFKGINDVAFQISKLPAVSDETQKLLTKLYKGNSADGFKNLTKLQQRQVTEAQATIELYDKAFNQLKTQLTRAGLGTTAASLNKSIRARKANAQRLFQVTSPAAMANLDKQDARIRENAAKREANLMRREAKTRALSEEKDRILQRTGGIKGLSSKGDITAVRSGLNRDYNLAAQRAAIAAATGKGGRDGAEYKKALASLEGVKAQRAELNALIGTQARATATQAKAMRDQQLWTQMQAIEENKRFNASKKLQEQRTVEEAIAEDKRRTKSAKDAEAWAWEQAKWEDRQRTLAAKGTGGTTLNTSLPRNRQQAQAILRQSGGDMSRLSKSQVATVRPYLQDRFKARSQYTEAIGSKYGSDSPEFGRAAASAQEYSRQLGELNNRAKELSPTMTNLGTIMQSFLRYALGYGALYQVLGGVTALGKGLVDLDEQLHNIQAITLSTDSQMKIIEGSIKQVGMTTKFTLNEVAQGAQILAQAGTAPERIPAQLKATADFAAATNSTLEQSADLLTSFQNVYTDISDGKAADLLTKTLNLSKLQGEDLRTIVSYTAQTAEGYNVSAEQLLGAVATLRNAGIKPSTIATGLRQAMLEVFNPDAKLLKALKTRYAQMGEDMSDATISGLYNSFTFADNPLVAAVSELKRIGFGGEASGLFSRAFDVRAFNPLTALVNNFDQFNNLSGQVGIGQSASDASAIQIESLRATVENLGASVVAFSDSVGGGMVGALQQAAEKATDLVEVLTELDLKMKAATGEGLASTIGSGLAGGAIGALLGGKGFLRKAGGFATGAYVGGGLEQAGSSEGSGSDYVLPALAGLITIVPTVMDFIGGLRGRRAEISDLVSKTKGMKAISGGAEALGPALSLGAGVADFFTMLGNAKLPTGMAGIGAAGGIRLAAGLFARAIPVIGLIWTAYELLQLFSDKGSDDLQAIADKQRVKAGASGDLYLKTKDKYDVQQKQVSEYTIDAQGNAAPNTTAARAVAMTSQADQLSTAMNAVFGANSAGLGDATKILEEYARRDRDQRLKDLTEIKRLTGVTLSDSEANSLSTQLEQLQKGTDGFRESIVNELNRANDAMREALAKGDAEGIRKAGEFQRVLSTMPEFAAFLYGQTTVDASTAASMMEEFVKKMAEESKNATVTAEEVLAQLVTSKVEDIASVALDLQNSADIDNAIQQIISGIRLTETNTVAALKAIADGAQKKGAELAGQANNLNTAADQAEAEANEAQANVDRVKKNPGAGGRAGAFLPQLEAAAKSARERADAARAAAGGANRQVAAEQNLAAAANSAEAREQQKDTLAKAAADSAAEEVRTRVLDALPKMTDEFKKTLNATQRAQLEQLQDPATRQQLIDSGAFNPTQKKTGVYQASSTQGAFERILAASQAYDNNKAEVSGKKAAEAAKAGSLSDPEAQVRIAQLQNEQRAAERRNDMAGAQAAAKKIYDVQYSEQLKAVERARIDMEGAKNDPKKDATSAIEKYSSERAKLENLRGEMTDKLDEYQKKVQDIDLKARTVKLQTEQKSLKNEFGEATDRGDIAAAQEASKKYSVVQAQLLKLAEEELAAKGYSPEQIELEVKAREDLTVALIDQEGAQKRLTSAVIARAEFEMRDAGKGPTTGSKGADAYLAASGIGFTNAQTISAYERDLELYRRGRDTLTSSYAQQTQGLTGDAKRSADQSYLKAIEEIDSKIGETAGHLQQLRNSFDQEILSAFNPTGMLSALQNSNSALQNIGETVQSRVVSAFDDLGTSVGRAIINAEDLGDAVQEVIFAASSDIFTSMFSTGVNYLGQQGLAALTGDNGTGQVEGDKAKGILSGLFGAATGSAVDTATVTAGTVYVNGAMVGGAGSVIPGLGENSAVTTGSTAAAAAGADQQSFIGKLGSTISEKISGITDGIGNLFSSFTSTLGNLFSGILGGSSGGDIGSSMKGGDWAKLGVQLVGSYFGSGASSSTYGAGAASASAGASSAGYSGASWDAWLASQNGYATGGQPSRMIEGKRSAKRDNLVAMADTGSGSRPIRVEADEGILSRSAMQAIGGEKGLRALNSGRMPAFASGGAATSTGGGTAPATTGQDNIVKTMQVAAEREQVAPEVNVANIYSDQGFADFVQSRNGRKVVINMLKKEGAI